MPENQDPMQCDIKVDHNYIEKIQGDYIHIESVTVAGQYRSPSSEDERLKTNKIHPNNEPITASKSENVGSTKIIFTEATLYRSGLLVVKTYSESKDPFHGLRGRVLIICRDSDGHAIWVSNEYKCTTRGSTFDFTCVSSGTDTWQEKLPTEVGELTAVLDIIQSDEGLGDFRNRVIDGIRTAQDIAANLKPSVQQLH